MLVKYSFSQFAINFHLSQLRGLDDVVYVLDVDDGGVVFFQVDALHGASDKLPAEGERVDEPHLERLLGDDEEVAVAEAVEEEVDGRVECQQDVRDDGEAVHPQRPRVLQVAVLHRLQRIEGRTRILIMPCVDFEGGFGTILLQKR